MSECDGWIATSLADLKIGDHVLGQTSTNSQKHGDEYNYAIEGVLIYKDEVELHKCKIRTPEGEIRYLCSWVGTSGYNQVCKK